MRKRSLERVGRHERAAPGPTPARGPLARSDASAPQQRCPVGRARVVHSAINAPRALHNDRNSSWVGPARRRFSSSRTESGSPGGRRLMWASSARHNGSTRACASPAAARADTSGEEPATAARSTRVGTVAATTLGMDPAPPDDRVVLARVLERARHRPGQQQFPPGARHHALRGFGTRPTASSRRVPWAATHARTTHSPTRSPGPAGPGSTGDRNSIIATVTASRLTRVRPVRAVRPAVSTGWRRCRRGPGVRRVFRVLPRGRRGS